MQTAKAMWRGEAEQCPNHSVEHRPWHDFVNNYRDSRAYEDGADPTENGLFKRELNRETPFGYTGFNLKALIHTPVIVERYDGTDLYSYTAPTDRKDGSTLWKAFNWFADWRRDVDAWERRGFNEESSVSQVDVRRSRLPYELAYAHWGDFEAATKNPDRVGGRPYFDRRVLGHVTLTHGAP